MNFKDIGIIIAKRPLMENSGIITVFTQNHGIYSGLFKHNKNSSNLYQEGNLIDFIWNARLHEHLGHVKAEIIKSYSSNILSGNKLTLFSFNSLISLVKIAFEERQPYNNFFEVFHNYIIKLIKGFDFRDYIRFELDLLNATGYSLMIKNCGVTGLDKDLHYVSPKSGRAISYEVGAPFANKLLELPKFLNNNNSNISALEKKQAIILTTYFLNRYLFNNREEPYSRKIFIESILE